MLTVRTVIGPSAISGTGLFAGENIPKGTVVWKFNPTLDISLTKEEVKELAAPAQKQFYNYSYMDPETEKYILCGDDARFFNHADDPNCDDSKRDTTLALRDIPEGEELTVNYRTFIGNLDMHPDIF